MLDGWIAVEKKLACLKKEALQDFENNKNSIKNENMLKGYVLALRNVSLELRDI